MHRKALSYVTGQVERLRLNQHELRALEIGSRNINGSVRMLFTNTHYCGIDLNAGRGVDIVSDAVCAPFPNETFDIVVCCEVLEHSPVPDMIIASAHRLLREDGILILIRALTSRLARGGY